VHLAGRIHVGERVFIGIGASIINGTDGHPLLIGADAVIGAGACVTRGVDPGMTVVGVPARPVRR
jgi:acetyltransferase-like isoleucine patch superfamily enzyme